MTAKRTLLPIRTRKHERNTTLPTQPLGPENQAATAVHLPRSQIDHAFFSPSLTLPVLPLSVRYSSGGTSRCDLPLSRGAGCPCLHKPCCLRWPHVLHICDAHERPLGFFASSVSTSSQPAVWCCCGLATHSAGASGLLEADSMDRSTRNDRLQASKKTTSQAKSGCIYRHARTAMSPRDPAVACLF